MVYVSIYKGILFVEGYEGSAKILGKIAYQKQFTYNSQIQTLECVKDQLVQRTLELGGNAVVNFQYGQKSSSCCGSFLCSLDDNVRWYGDGLAAIIPEERKQEMLDLILYNGIK